MRDKKIWLSSARRCPSPNFDERPGNCPIDLLVLHCISLPPGEFGGPWIDEFFSNRLDPSAHPYFSEIRDMRVSSHLLIRRSGELVQYVPFSHRAWHAGQSEYRGRTQCNDFSVGIELEGTDDDGPFEPDQYRGLALVAREIMNLFPGITEDRIVGHSEIAPERKTDPGSGFDWHYFRSLLQEP